MKILNLYSGLGGNRKLWSNDHNITSVEYNEEIADVYKQNFPNDEVIIGDAHQYLLDHYDKYDFIWSSPPCQSHTQMVKATRHDVRKYPDMSLYQEIIFLDNFYDGKWVVENVNPYYKPLIQPQKIGRHLFWSNFKIGNINPPKKPNFINESSVEASQRMKDWLGIQYEGNLYYENNHCPSQVLRNCVHPKIGKYILDRALDIYSKSNQEQTSLFD